MSCPKCQVTAERELERFACKVADALNPNPNGHYVRVTPAAALDMAAKVARELRAAREEIRRLRGEVEAVPKCQSPNHDDGEEPGELWTCRCGRTVCSACEGTTDRPDLCDECWVRERE